MHCDDVRAEGVVSSLLLTSDIWSSEEMKHTLQLQIIRFLSNGYFRNDSIFQY